MTRWAIAVTMTATALLGSALAASAQSVHGSFSSGWADWSNSDLDENGLPFWDAPSLDGSQRNIGYALSGSPSVGLPDAPGNIPFWQIDTGTSRGPDPNFLLGDGDHPMLAELKLENAAFARQNEFGWYDPNSPATLHAIFGGSASAGASAIFTPAGEWGLYLKSGDGNTYYSQSALNPGAENAHQHFALFWDNTRPGNVYWVGAEESSQAALGAAEMGNGDFNDLVVRLACIPESSTLSQLALGLAVLAAVIRRTRWIRPV